MNYICFVLSLISLHKWEAYQLDVKFSFLQRDFHKEIYIEEYPRYVQNDSIFYVSLINPFGCHVHMPLANEEDMTQT